MLLNVRNLGYKLSECKYFCPLSVGMIESTFKEDIKLIPEELVHYPVHTTSVEGDNLQLTSVQLSNVKGSSGGSKMKVVRKLPDMPYLFRRP